MLYFYKAMLYFDFEYNEYDEFYATKFERCDNSNISTYFPNINIITDKIEFSTLLSSNESTKKYLLTPKQMRGLIGDWLETSTYNKLYNWDASSYFMELINTMKQIAAIDAKYQYDGGWTGEAGIFDTEKIDIINNLAVNSTEEYPFNLSKNLDPEFSIKVEDALYAVKNNTSSLYTTEINELVQKNISKIKLVKDLYSNFVGDVFVPTIDLTDGITVEDIDYTNPESIMYFYYYSFLPGVSTNLVHLKNVIGAMK